MMRKPRGRYVGCKAIMGDTTITITTITTPIIIIITP